MRPFLVHGKNLRRIVRMPREGHMDSCIKMFVVATLTLCALAGRGENITIGDFSYSYSLSTKEGTITKYNGSAENVVIPQQFSAPETYKDSDGETHTRYHTISVIAIGNSAFANKEFVTSATFHGNLKSIGREAFSGCTGLTSVRTPNSLASLGESAFAGCMGLVEAEVDGSGLVLQRFTFNQCVNLRRVVLGDGVVQLQSGSYGSYNGWSWTFPCCTNLQSVVVGSGVSEVPPYFLCNCGNAKDKLSASFSAPITSVGECAFSNGNITNLNIQLSSCNVGGCAFRGCPAVNERNIDFSEIVYIESYSAFAGCGNIRGEINLSRATRIGDSAFQGCTGISSVKFGERLTSIVSSAFYGSSSASNFVFNGAPPSVGNNAFKNVKNGAIGTYTAAHAAEWEAVIDDKGYWNGLKMKPSYYTVIYDANNGSGATIARTVEWGEPTPAGDGTFTWEGHVFTGWAFAPDGEVACVADDTLMEPTDDSVVTLYAQWATVTPESADWSEGSITLSAMGFTGNSIEDISISYCNANTGGMVWLTPEDGEITKVWSADGKTLLVTDSKFSRRLDGVCPIKYRIVDKFGHAVDSPSTRNRHGLAVGVSKYDKVKYGSNAPEETESHRKDAELFIEVMERIGGGVLHENMISLMDKEATTNAISAAWKNLVETATIPGDLIFFYIATHGGNRKETSGRGNVTAYDGPYTAQQFQSDLATFKRGGIREGVKVVTIMDTCHSESMTMPYGADEVGNLFSDSANILYVTSASAEESSIHSEMHSQFALCFFKNGQELGQADAQRMMHGQSAVGEIGNRDGKVDLLECARYAQELSTGWSSIFPAHVTYDFEKASIMADTILVAGSSHAPEPAPGAPINVEVKNWDEGGVSVCFDEPSNADFFKIYYQKVDDMDAPKWIISIDSQCDIYTLDMATERYRERNAQLMNGAAYRFWVVACGPGGMSDPSEFVEFTTPIEYSRTFAVGFDANGARDAYGNPISLGAIVVPAWKEVGSLPELDWAGHTFVGWYFNKDGHGERVKPTTIIVRDSTCYAVWTAMTMEYLNLHSPIATAAGGDIATAAAMTAANGCRTVGECYALGIDPEDPNDDLKITAFKMKDGKPEITLNHTKDGSGNSFEDRVKILGKAELDEGEWQEVPPEGNPAHRFFKVKVKTP